MMLYIILGLVWYALGFFGVVYWWTKDYDFNISGELSIAIMYGFFGPCSWVVGYFLHSDREPTRKKERTIFKRRSPQ